MSNDTDNSFDLFSRGTIVTTIVTKKEYKASQFPIYSVNGITFKMSPLRLLVVSLALLAIIGFVACEEKPGAKNVTEKSVAADSVSEKRKKLQELMKKSCEKADIKEEQLLKMQACHPPPPHPPSHPPP